MTYPNHDQIADDLEGTRALLFERGWQRGRFVGTNGQLCIIGAIKVTVEGERPNWNECGPERVFALCAALADQLPPGAGPCDVADWQDRPERRFDEVVDLIDRTIKVERCGGEL